MTQIFSTLITFVIYLIILVVLSVIYIDQYSDLTEREVFVEFREYEKKVIKQKVLPNIKKDLKRSKVTKEIVKIINKEFVQNSEVESMVVETDSILISINDSLKDKMNWLDSLVVNNPNLQILKYASEDYIKKNPLIKSDSTKVAEGIRNFMQDYYNSKYPTPVYKFGDGAPGIAIDDIIDIFKSDDVDEEKIKKYLKIGKYK